MARPRWRLMAGAALTTIVVLAACADNGTTPTPDEFANVVVDSIVGVAGGAFLWVVGLDLENTDGDGQYFARFNTEGECNSETGQIFVTAGRTWSEDFGTNCREQPIEVVIFSLREGGFIVTDRDSIPLLEEPQ